MSMRGILRYNCRMACDGISPRKLQVKIVVLASPEGLVKPADRLKALAPIQHGGVHSDQIAVQKSVVGIALDLTKIVSTAKAAVLRNKPIPTVHERPMRKLYK